MIAILALTMPRMERGCTAANEDRARDEFLEVPFGGEQALPVR